MPNRRDIALGLMYIIATVFSSSYIVLQPDSVEEETISIAAFNIKTFGRAKRQKEDVMTVLTKIVGEFDLTLVQEIKDSSKQTAPYFLQRINEMEDRPKYEYVRSERLGRSTQKEVYAYFYNNETVEFIQGSDYVYDDVDDVFEREPYIASFKAGSFDFTLVGIHTKPDYASSEIGSLPLVVSSIQEARPDEEDIIVIGDLNADGSYFDEDDATSPLKASEYYWAITNDMDTMTSSDNTYDRIVLLNTTWNHEYVAGSAGVFYFDQEYGIDNQTLIGKISDHYPVFAEYRTSLADDD